MKLLRWAVQECYPAYMGPGDPIDAECVVVAQFLTRRGAIKFVKREWPGPWLTRSRITHGIVRWDPVEEEWRAAT